MRADRRKGRPRSSKEGEMIRNIKKVAALLPKLGYSVSYWGTSGAAIGSIQASRHDGTLAVWFDECVGLVHRIPLPGPDSGKVGSLYDQLVKACRTARWNFEDQESTNFLLEFDYPVDGFKAGEFAIRLGAFNADVEACWKIVSAEEK